VERQLELRAKVVLIKFADGMVHDSISGLLTGLRMGGFVSTMKDIVNGLMGRVLSDPGAFGIEKVEDIASLVQLHLEIFKSLLQSEEGTKISREESAALCEVLIGTSPLSCTPLTLRNTQSIEQVYSQTRINYPVHLRRQTRPAPLINHRSLQRHKEGHHRNYHSPADAGQRHPEHYPRIRRDTVDLISM